MNKLQRKRAYRSYKPVVYILPEGETTEESYFRALKRIAMLGIKYGFLWIVMRRISSGSNLPGSSNGRTKNQTFGMSR